MLEDELSMEELEQVGTNSFLMLNDFMTAYEKGDLESVIELGTGLLNNAGLDDNQKEQISKMVSEAKSVLASKSETKGLGY